MKPILQSMRLLGIMTVILGIIYPGLVWVIGLVIFPKFDPEKLIGQEFQKEIYFWGRPSATNYDPNPASASHLGPTSKQLKEQIDQRLARLLRTHSGKTVLDVPEELLMASASGLDPDVTPAAIEFQFDRVVKARRLSPEKTRDLRNEIEVLTKRPSLGFFGRFRINVLSLNRALDRID